MFIFLEKLLLLLKTIQMQSSFLSHKEVSELRTAINPLNQVYLLVVLLDLNYVLNSWEKGKETAFHCEKKKDITFVVVGQISYDVGFGEF